MPAKRIWTESEIEALRSMMANGVSTRKCAVHFGVSRQYLRRVRKDLGIPCPVSEAHTRIRKVRLQKVDPAAAPPREPAPDPRVQNWWPLPPGHPETWGAIVRGTCLEGQEYPRHVLATASTMSGWLHGPPR